MENCQICNVCDFIEHFVIPGLPLKPLWICIESRLHVKFVLADAISGFRNGNRNYDVLNRFISIKNYV